MTNEEFDDLVFLFGVQNITIRFGCNDKARVWFGDLVFLFCVQT